MTENDGSDIRRHLFDYIKKNPGSTFRVIQTAFRMSEGNLRYHLHHLERDERIIFEKEGKDRCYFTSIRRKKNFAGIELSRGQERILDLIERSPGISVDELKVRSGEDRSSFLYDLRKLRENKLIWRVKRGNVTVYEALTQERLENELFLDVVTRFTEGNASKEELMAIVSKLEKKRKN